jgi:hypothetical protein
MSDSSKTLFSVCGEFRLKEDLPANSRKERSPQQTDDLNEDIDELL